MTGTTNSTINNPWFGVSMALVGVIVGYGVAISSGDTNAPLPAAAPTPQAAPQAAQPTPAAPTAQSVVAPDSKTDHIKGNVKAAISLIEYSDFECPFCQRHHPTMQQAVDEYDGKVNWVYRHYPLNFHPNAKPAAMASECAAELGGNDAFWAFSDLVITKGPDQASLTGYAVEIGIDKTAFESCVSSGKYSKHVDDQLAEGSASGVRGTPGTIVFNNKTKESRYISGAQPYSNVKAAIDELL
jgi:protein-disulfide isomerase